MIAHVSAFVSHKVASVSRGPAFVTGGAGFIGSHLIGMLEFPDAARPWVYDARTYAASAWDDVHEVVGERLIQGDVRDPASLADALDVARPSVVYHLAAESHVDRSLEEPDLAFAVNALGTMVVARLCAERDIPLVYCSTDEVYGDLHATVWADGGAVEHQTPVNPSSPYSAGKAAGEDAVRAVARSYGLRAVITRGSNAYGPGQYPEKLVPILCRCLTAGQTVPLHGGGEQVRQWVHVEEFARVLVAAGRHAEDMPHTGVVPVFNIAGPQVLSVRQLAAMVARTAGTDPALLRPSADRPGQDRVYRVSGDKTARMLNERPCRCITSDIENLIRHYGTGQVEIAGYAR